MAEFISTLGLQQLNINNLCSGQAKLSLLSTQLATGVKSSNLTDYSSSEAQNLMNYNTSIAMRTGFQSATSNISARLSVYDQSLTAIEDVAAQANSTCLNGANYNSEQNDSIASLLQGYMEEVSYYLDQKVGDRYIFAGTRYSTVPVGDIAALPVPPTETSPYVTTGNALPSYDADYDASNPNVPVPEAYVRDQVSIDTNQKLTYGITSTQEGFQQLILGLRFAYAATQDVTNYDTYMTTARDLITDGLTSIRGLHTDISNSITTIDSTNDLHTTMVNTLQNQIDDIEAIDVNEVAVKITTYQAQLEASYAATAKMTNLSILNYM